MCNRTGVSVRELLFRLVSCWNMDDDWMHWCKRALSPIPEKTFFVPLYNGANWTWIAWLYRLFYFFFCGLLPLKRHLFIFLFSVYFLLWLLAGTDITAALVHHILLCFPYGLNPLIMHCLLSYEVHSYICTEDFRVRKKCCMWDWSTEWAALYILWLQTNATVMRLWALLSLCCWDKFSMQRLTTVHCWVIFPPPGSTLAFLKYCAPCSLQELNNQPVSLTLKQKKQKKSGSIMRHCQIYNNS